jgi:translation initiation factor IF-2
MSDTTDTPRERKPLGLKRSIDAGEVKQTFSHGRTNKVVVEVKRRRLIGKPGEAPAPAPAPEPVVEVAPPPPPPAPKKPAPAAETPQERVARLQREAEEERLRLGEEATKREASAKTRAVEEEKRRAEENRRAEAEAEARAAEEAEVAPAEEAVEAPAETDDTGSPTPAPRRFTPVERPEAKRPEKKREEQRKGAPAGRGGDDRRRGGKLTVSRALNEDEGARARSLAALKRAREKERRAHTGGTAQPREKQVRDVVVPEAITVQELANRMAEKGAALVKALFNMDMVVTVNQTIDQDTAELLVEEFGHNIVRVSESRRRHRQDRGRRCRRDAAVAPAGGHDHGPRRPRQDQPARRAARHRRGQGRGRRHHPAHRRLPDHYQGQAQDHLPRYARPRGVHADAPARRERDRHRGAGGSGR